MDQEIIEIFTEEIGELRGQLAPIFESLKANNQQPDQFKNFSQIVDRIYGTATTMGFDDIGNYLGAVRNISRKASSSNIPVGMQAVYKISKTCMENFEVMQKSLSSPKIAKELTTTLNMELKKMDKIEKEIFSYSKDASSIFT